MNWEIFEKPLVLAHRGDTKAGLENTLPAIASALEMGVDGIEVDLQITRDGHVVLFHDDDLKRLAGRSGRIGGLTLAECRSLSLEGGSRIPTLDELLDLVQDRCLLNLEIKTRPHWYVAGRGRLERKIAESLRRFALDETILLSSFQPISLWRMKRFAPDLRRGTLFENKYALHRMLTPWTSPFSFHAPLALATPQRIRAVHDAGRRFLVWTVNDENDMKRCLENGVDGIITDEPRRLKVLVQRTSGGRQ